MNFGNTPNFTHSSMNFFVTYYMVCGNTPCDQVRELYPAATYDPERCRKEFTARYYGTDVKGITVTPLYTLRRYH